MPANLFDLSGRVALVTGGARGLGRAIALGLAQHGGAVAIADRDGPGAEDTAQAIRSAGGRAMGMAGDVSRENDVQRLIDGALSEFGQLDILVNNAGITKRLALFDWTEADWDEVLASDAAAMITGHILPIDGGVSGIVSLTNEAVVR